MKNFNVNKIDTSEYSELFNTNMEGKDFSQFLNEESLKSELSLFEKSTSEQMNYTSNMNLKKWGLVVDGEDVGDRIGDIDKYGLGVLKKHVIDYISNLNVKSVLDAGAGGGMNTKILSTEMSDKTKFYCVENHKNHCEHIKENLSEKSDVNKPHVKVKNFELINASLHNIPLEDNSVELIFSHAVLSHIPYIPVVLAIKEFSRISSKYVVHVEQKNSIINIVVPGYTKSPANKSCTVNYKKIYDKLGFKEVKYEEVSLGVNNQVMCVYVGEKI
tara:strand:- start:557 stop:1375 length:819 start_codon:yes stop_codon:yes gene_type:complete